MSLSVDSEGGAVVLGGRFDAYEVGRFREVVDPLAMGDGDLPIHLKDVRFIDSTGLAELVRIMKRRREHGGDVVLVAPSDPVAIILELTGLSRAFRVLDPAA